MGRTLGAWAFLVGVILAVIIGVGEATSTTVGVLALLGIIVGLLNVSEEEVGPFMFAGAVASGGFRHGR
jgi:di/tricarboxylate transporter